MAHVHGAGDERTEGGAGRGAGLAQRDLETRPAGLRLQLGRGAAGDHAAVVDDDDPVGELVGLVEVLGREQQGDAVGDELSDHVPHPHPAGGVEAGRRLVEEQHRRSRHEAGGEIQAPAHPARVALQDPVGRVGEIELGEQLSRSRPRLHAAQAAQASDHHEVLATGEDLVEGGVLGGDADVAPHGGRLADDVMAGDPRRAAVGDREGGEDAHGGGLAGAVRVRARRGWRPPAPRRSIPSSATVAPNRLCRPWASIIRSCVIGVAP